MRYDLGYLNARVRGLRSSLFKGPDYEALIGLDAPSRFIDRLKGTVYGPFISAASIRYKRPEQVVTGGLAAGFTAALEQLWKSAPDPARPLVGALFSVWEVHNIKALLRGISRGIRGEDLMDVLLPVGELNAGPLALLSRAKNVADLVSLLETWGMAYAVPLKAGMDAYTQHGSTMEMELKLELFVTRSLLARLAGRSYDRRVIRGVVASRADALNVMTLMKLPGEGYSALGAEGLFVEGGAGLPKGLFVEAAGMKDREEVLTFLLSGVKEPGLRKVLKSEYAARVELIEQRLEAYTAARLRRAALVEPLSVALAASYIYMLFREVKNLRLISRAIGFQIPEDELRRHIIFPI